MNEHAITVNVPVDDPDIPVWSEVMRAAPDPADADQAVLLNVPFLVDGLNFGDLVRLGEADENGVRPIVEVVLASGHTHVIAATEDGEAAALAAELERTFPDYALRIVAASENLLGVSIHPHLDPELVFATIAEWLAVDAGDPDESLAISPVLETRIGPIEWPTQLA